MILNLEHRLFSRKEKKKWIYFGSSYLKLLSLEKKKDKTYRISLSKENLKNIIKEKKIFLHWLDEQNSYYNDSIFWWMNSIASKSNLSSIFFNSISQLSSIKEYIENNKKHEKSITITSENYHFIKLLIDNLNDSNKLNVPKFLPLLLLLEKIFLILGGIFNYLKIFYYFKIHYFFSFLSKQKKKYLEGEVYLFHDLINSSKFKEGVVQSRYYGDFPAWLEKKGKQVISLPWFYSSLKEKKKLYYNLRARNSFIPEDWLNIIDYYKCIKYSIISCFSISEKILYPNHKIINLIKYEKLMALKTNKSAIYLRYVPAIKNWSKNVTSIKFFDHYQNQSYEHPIRYGLKNLEIKSKSVGYYHSLHSINFLPYQSSTKEWQSKSKPDYVACSSNICKKILAQQGLPENRIKVISDLQRENFKDLISKKFNKNMLVILSLYPESNYEILNKILKINNFLQERLKLKVTIRSHPYLNNLNLLRKLNCKQLPNNWNWSKGDLKSDLDENCCVITMHSAVITDAVLYNNILIILKSELNNAENYLDYLENKFPILKPTLEIDLEQKLKDIFLSKTKFYKDTFFKIKNEIGININKKNYQELEN